MSFCPCGSQQSYERCCERFIEKKAVPQTPEQLMRSRYTAYSLANIDYIKNTMKGKPLIGFDAAALKKWAQKVTWLGLKVIRSYIETPEVGFVEFSARYIEENQLKEIHEISEFRREQNSWYYVEGQNKELTNKKQRIPRNSVCPCGSGKKYKNCHAKTY